GGLAHADGARRPRRLQEPGPAPPLAARRPASVLPGTRDAGTGVPGMAGRVLGEGRPGAVPPGAPAVVPAPGRAADGPEWRDLRGDELRARLRGQPDHDHQLRGR